MNNHHRRPRQIEVSLSPSQVVLLWMKNVLSSTYEKGALQSQPPRSAIANSIARTVRDGLKGEPDTIVDRAILQARQEADWLYMIVVDVNSRVQTQYFQSEREFTFLLGYFAATIGRSRRSVSETQVRALTLAFVNPILVLEGAVSRISTDRFDAHSILYSDSAARLKEQLELVDEILGISNSIARRSCFRELSKKEISDSLASEVAQQVSHWSMISRSGMLAAFGKWSEFRGMFDQLAATLTSA